MVARAAISGELERIVAVISFVEGFRLDVKRLWTPLHLIQLPDGLGPTSPSIP